MLDFVTIVALALLPALGNFSGGLAAEMFRVSPRNLNWALHAASGVVLAIVATEIMPRGLENASTLTVAVAFAMGGLGYLCIQALVERMQSTRRGQGSRHGMWMIYAAVATDLFSDGLMIGAGGAVASNLALVLALGQVLADLPEGFATVANFKDKGVPRRKRVWLSALFAAPALLGAILAYTILRSQDDAIKTAGLVFTAGILMVAAVEDIISQAHASAEDSKASVVAFIGGFVLFILVSAGLKN